MSKNSSTLKIFCFGDSLTAGTSPPLNDDHPYAPFLEKQLHQNVGFESAMVRWYGLPGWTASQLDQENILQPLLEKIKTQTETYPSLVIILAGTNDLAYESSCEKILESIKAIHKTAHEKEIQTLAVGIPPSAWQSHSESAKLLASNVNDSLASWATKMDATEGEGRHVLGFVPFPIEEFDRESALWCSDGLHFSPLGYKFIGESLGSTIWKILQKQQDTQTETLSR